MGANCEDVPLRPPPTSGAETRKSLARRRKPSRIEHGLSAPVLFGRRCLQVTGAGQTPEGIAKFLALVQGGNRSARDGKLSLLRRACCLKSSPQVPMNAQFAQKVAGTRGIESVPNPEHTRTRVVTPGEYRRGVALCKGNLAGHTPSLS